MRRSRLIIDRQIPSPPPGAQATNTRSFTGPGTALAGSGQEGEEDGGCFWRCINSDVHPPFLKIFAASELADRERAYGLGYRIYRAMGYAGQEEHRVLVTPSDARPDTLVLLATDPRGGAAGTVSLWFDHPGGLPCEALYPREVSSLRDAGGRLVEAGRFATHDAYRNSTMLLARLLNLIFLYACRVKASSHLLCTVNPRHVAFYMRKLHFRRLGGPCPCPRVKGAIAELLTLDLRDYTKAVQNAHGPDAGARAEGKANFYRKFLDPGRELEAAAFLSRIQRPMSKEIAAYYSLNS